VLPDWQRSRFRLLLAEDNITNQRVAQGILQKLGFRADVVANGREAIQSLKSIPYDLVLMDCQMPEMDGYEATRAIREPASGVCNPQIPIIAMTAYAMQGDRERCLRAGMNDYVSKPVQHEALAETLDRWLGQLGQTSRSPLMAVHPQGRASEQIFDEKEFVERLMGDRELARSITRSFVAEASNHVSDLKVALARSSIDSAIRHAHSLKGSSANLGAHQVRDTAQQMERLLKAGDRAAAAALMGTLDHRFEVLTAVLEVFLKGGAKQA
jgi:CheY-like chemotaxis protein/HPt (histidine-containing phosphotransfer) domain-containing protein